MESESSVLSTSLTESDGDNCISSTIKKSSSGRYLGSVTNKYDDFDEESMFSIPGFIIPPNARVEVENECTALREMVNRQQQTIQNLMSELEEERNAASSAANEAMSMILRLQRDKAEIQMESRQFKRFAEEKMAHDQQETLALEDLLYKREEVIRSLTCEVQAYKHRLMSYGFTEAEADGDVGMSQNNGMTVNVEGQSECPPYEIYPPLKCNSNGSWAYLNDDDETSDIEIYEFGQTPRSCYQLRDLEYRNNQLEKTPRAIQPDDEFIRAKNVLEKVIVGQSPRAQRHPRKFWTEHPNSPFAMTKEMGQARYSPNFGSSFKKTKFSYIEESPNLRNANNASEFGDELSDRVYTIDPVYQGASINGIMSSASIGIDCDEYMGTPRESLNHSNVKDLEIQKLYARLHALEADRESMRQAIVSIGTEKTQVVLLKEIAQSLSKDISPPRRMPVRKQSVIGSFSFMSLFKWIIPFFFWRKEVRRCRYMFGLSANIGLLLLLDRSPQVGLWRHILCTNMWNQCVAPYVRL